MWGKGMLSMDRASTMRPSKPTMRLSGSILTMPKHGKTKALLSMDRASTTRQSKPTMRLSGSILTTPKPGIAKALHSKL